MMNPGRPGRAPGVFFAKNSPVQSDSPVPLTGLPNIILVQNFVISWYVARKKTDGLNKII
jgi:hypothetical protein